MKFGTKILALFAAVILVGGGFSAGRYVADQENMATRAAALPHADRICCG